MNPGTAGESPSIWTEDPVPSEPRPPNPALRLSVWLLYATFAASTLLLPTLIFAVISKTLAIIWLAFLIYVAIRAVILVRRSAQQRRAQAAARSNFQERIGATVIGSARHVAGMSDVPLGERVVLALRGQTFAIYPLTAANPLTELQGAEITSLATVVYDDERIPHTDVIDQNAQALQITYKRGQNTLQCLFDRMRFVTPIRWYHELQGIR